MAGAVTVLALGGCSEDEPTPSGSGSGPPPCSDFANGEVITEELSLAGCEGDGVTTNESTRCGDQHQAIAVGPVYGFVGKPANYLGDGEDATTSEEWEQFQQDCPYDSE
jgi:hypothetical protein